jgi:hypothetical protein
MNLRAGSYLLAFGLISEWKWAGALNLAQILYSLRS